MSNRAILIAILVIVSALLIIALVAIAWALFPPQIIDTLDCTRSIDVPGC